MGAMENAGCVTINEMYVFRSKVTESLVERRALTVLHELAHMWFGNLVTMRWWNDLWLNESFAEWASTTCQSEATALDRRLDHVRHPREGLGLPPGPAQLDPPDRRRDPRPARTSRSTSTASPTPRAPRCSSSSSPTSAASRSATACAPTSPSTPGATPPSTTSSPSSRRPPGATCAPGRRCGSRPPASARCARWSRSTTGAASRRPPSSRPARPGFETLRPHTPRHRAVRRARRRAPPHRPPRARRRRRAHRGARARRPGAARPAARQRRRPRLRQDPARRALARHGPGPPPGLRLVAAPLARAGLAVGHDPRRRDGRAPLRRRRARDAARRERQHAAAHAHHPAADRGALLHRARAPRRRAPVDPRPALGGRPLRRARQRRPAAAGQRGRRPDHGRRRHHAAARPARRHRGARGPHRRLRDALDPAHRPRRGGAADDAEIDAERAREDTATGRERAARARAARPTARGQGAGVGRGRRGQRAAERRGRGDAHWASPARAPPPTCCARSSTATTPCSTPSRAVGRTR